MNEAGREDRGARILAEIPTKGDFPAALQVVERLRRMVGRDECTTLGLAGVILQDTGLSAKVLRAVNSAFYRTRGVPVSTITRAIILLGFDRISELATGLLLLDQFMRAGRRSAVLREHLRRSLRCGIVAQLLSKRRGQVVPEEAYLLGMFSNLGLLWLATHYPDDHDAAIALERSGEAPSLEEAVTRTLGVSPAAIAIGVLEQWGLPGGYASYFRQQEERGTGDGTACADGGLSSIVALADAYARAGDGEPSPELLGRLEALLSLSAEQTLALLRRAESEFKEQIKVLGLEAPAGETGAPPVTPAGLASRPPKSEEAEGGALPDAVPRRPDRGLALEIVGEIAQLIRVRDDVGGVMRVILEGIARSGSFDAVVLALVARERDRLVARLGYGQGVEEQLDHLSVPLRERAGLLAESFLDGAAHLVPDGVPAMLVPPWAHPPAIPASSFAIEPLIARGRAVGLILAARGGAPKLSEDDVPLLRLFADLACIALTEVGSRRGAG